MRFIIPVITASGLEQMVFDQLCDCKCEEPNVVMHFENEMPFQIKGVSCKNCFRWFYPKPE